jgi:hypothetical protein
VDVNVAIVANGSSSQADSACVLACIDALTEVKEHGIIVLDDGLRIINEYRRHLSFSGQPGLGDFFFKWMHDNQAVDGRCERVSLTPRNGDPGDFVEFPDDPALNSFDRSDRKYVAAALSSRLAPRILNAVDTDWWNHRTALEANGVQIKFLCPQCMVR